MASSTEGDNRSFFYKANLFLMNTIHLAAASNRVSVSREPLVRSRSLADIDQSMAGYSTEDSLQLF